MSQSLTNVRDESPRATPARALYVLIGVLATLVVILGAIAVYGLVGDAKPASSFSSSTVGEEGSLVVFDSFIVNLADATGDRYLKATLRAVSAEPDLGAALDRNLVLKTKVRDRIITVLTAKTFAELSSPFGKETLRRELAREINAVLGGEAVSEVLFVEFVVQ